MIKGKNKKIMFMLLIGIVACLTSLFICFGQNAYADEDYSSDGGESNPDYLAPVERIDFIRTETIGGDTKQVRYYPVFDADHYPEGARFFGEDGNEYAEMNPNITYATVPEGSETTITAVRDIKNVKYNSVYGEGGEGPKPVLDSWALANLAKGESVEKLSQQISPSGEPQINTIGITTIWKALNPEKCSDGFGDSIGHSWSCVPYNGSHAWCWFSESRDWRRIDRDKYKYGNGCVCVTRSFNLASTEYNLATDSNGEWKEGSTTVRSITVIGKAVPSAEETITYKGLDGNQHTVTATPKIGYQFNSCSYDVDTAGTKTFTASFKPAHGTIEFIREETVGGHKVKLKYYPVFSSVPAGVTFYSGDGKKTYTSMNSEIAYAMVPEGSETTITAVRDIENVKYNSVYGMGGEGPKDVLDSWAQDNLATGESVEKLSQQASPSGEPQINMVGLTTIWKALNPEESSYGFGGSHGLFWSCVTFTDLSAYNWHSFDGALRGWNNHNRDYDIGMYVCLSRIFN